MRRVLLFIFCFISLHVNAQIGGTGVFSILKTVPDATTNGWGGNCVSMRNAAPTAMLNNPALLGPAAHNVAVMNFNTQFPGIWSGNAAYGMQYKNWGYFGLSYNFINYGSMKAYDAGGNAEGEVSANESVMALGFSRALNPNLSYGANVKVAYSILAGYVANGMAFDFGAIYNTDDSIVSLGLVFRNAGFMVQHYRDSRREKLPFQAEIGVNFKPRHMPFRFNIVAHNLQKFDLTYSEYLENENKINLNGEPEEPKPASLGDKIARHFTIGTELVLGKNFGILFGYNHQRRREMAPAELRMVSGYSWGLHFKVSKFNITYSSASFFPGFNNNLFTFSASLSDFQRK